MSSQRRSLLIAAMLWVLGAVVYVAAEALTAAAFPGYSYATNYISDLGVPDVGSFQGRAIDSPRHELMNAAFVVQGVLYFAAVLLAVKATKIGPPIVFLMLAGLFALGNALVGSVHGSQASVDNGSAVVHVIGAAMAILGGNTLAIAAGIGTLRTPNMRTYGRISIFLGAIGTLALLMLQIDSNAMSVNLLPDGVWERVAVYTITAWQFVTGALILTNVARSPQGDRPVLRRAAEARSGPTGTTK
ncbi:DUF998 domain-containing protein [Vibrio cholerae]|nr:DUF998 domain-containing protein [Vibrio cholerae]